MRGLGLKSADEWRAYCKSGKKPDDIPADPNQTYAKAGWAGYGDWLGYERSGTVIAKRGPKKGRARHLRQRMPRGAPPQAA